MLQYQELITQYAEQFNVPAELISSICEVESHWNPYAIRFEPMYQYYDGQKAMKDAKRLFITYETEIMLLKSSIGLCQVMGALARELGHESHLLELTDPKLNLFLASKHLGRLFKKYHGYLDDVIAAYNAGSPQRDTSNGQYKNQTYVNKVKNLLEKYRVVVKLN